MRWGFGIALFAAVALLTAPAGAAAEDGPVYAPVYEPAEEPSSPPQSPGLAPAVPAARAGCGSRCEARRRLRSNGRAIVFVRVFAPGRVFVWGRGIRRLARGTGRPRIVRVPVRPKVRLRRWLRRHGKGRIRINVAFRPYGGIARPPRERPVLLRKKHRRR